MHLILASDPLTLWHAAPTDLQSHQPAPSSGQPKSPSPYVRPAAQAGALGLLGVLGASQSSTPLVNRCSLLLGL